MKKLFPVILIIAIGLFAWLLFQDESSPKGASSVSKNQSQQVASTQSNGVADPSVDSTANGGVAINKDTASGESNVDDDYYEEIKPATEIYSSADQAMAALKKAAVDYDDLVLEQFAELDKDCSWCDELYSQVQEQMTAPDLSEDERSYYAEVLAISGRVDNVSYLIDTIKATKDPDLSDVYTEALEITYGGDEVVSYLGEQLQTEDEILKESIIAALTNHGSRQTIDLLYNETINSGDSDGFYSLGIGLGEIIPDDEAMPYLVDLANRRDEYSHLAIKALLNAGDNGLRSVLDIVASSNDAEANKKLLVDAIDHVPYEDGTEQYLKEFIKTTQSPTAKEFAQEILEDLSDVYADDSLTVNVTQ